LSFLILSFLGHGYAPATTVVVISNATKVFIAADSKVIEDGPGRKGSHQECKVKLIGTNSCCAAVVQGLTWAEQYSGPPLFLKRTWDLWIPLEVAIKRSTTVEEAVRIAESQMADEFRPFADGYTGRKGPDHQYFGYVIAGIRPNGEAVVALGGMPATADGKLLPHSEIVENKGIHVSCLGQCDAIDAYRRSHPSVLGNFGVAAVELVNLEVQADPKEVGLHISLFVLSQKGGSEWRQCGVCNQGPCPK
jgi:hypothetical protein